MNRFRLVTALLPLALATCQLDSSGTQPFTAVTPGNPATPSKTAGVANWYSHESTLSLFHAGKYKDGESACLQAIDAIEKSRGDKSPELAPPLIDLATIYLRQARWVDAKAVIDRAEPLMDPNIPAQALLLGRFDVNKAWRLQSLGETAGATKIFESALALVEKNQPGDSVDKAELINDLALVYEDLAQDNEDQDQLKLARTMLLKAWEMRRRVTGDLSPETAESLSNLGMFLLLHADELEDDPSAIHADLDLGFKTVHKALDVSIQIYGEENPETASAHSNMAFALMMNDEYDDAEKEIQKAIPVTLRTLGASNPDRADELTTLGLIQVKQLEFDSAEKAFIEAVTINEEVYGLNDPHVASSLESLANLYEKIGDTARKLQIQRRIDRINGKGI